MKIIRKWYFTTVELSQRNKPFYREGNRGICNTQDLVCWSRNKEVCSCELVVGSAYIVLDSL